jgi:DNA-binding phage protein
MAQGKISELAKHAGVDRTSLYRMLSKNSNPSYNNVISFISDLGMNFNIVNAAK